MTGKILLSEELWLYPPRMPHRSDILGRWTGVLLLISCLGAYLYWKEQQQKLEIPKQETIIQEAFSLNMWIKEFQKIDTSVRTPRQKALCLFVHLQVYFFERYGLDLSRKKAGSLSGEELKPYISTDLANIYQQFAYLIYSEQYTTHQHIHQLVTSCIDLLQQEEQAKEEMTEKETTI